MYCTALEVEDTKNMTVFVFKEFGSRGTWIIAIGQYNTVSACITEAGAQGATRGLANAQG